MNSGLFACLMCIVFIVIQGVVIFGFAKILSVLNDRILPDEES